MRATSESNPNISKLAFLLARAEEQDSRSLVFFRDLPTIISLFGSFAFTRAYFFNYWQGLRLYVGLKPFTSTFQLFFTDVSWGGERSSHFWTFQSTRMSKCLYSRILVSLRSICTSCLLIISFMHDISFYVWHLAPSSILFLSDWLPGSTISRLKLLLYIRLIDRFLQDDYLLFFAKSGPGGYFQHLLWLGGLSCRLLLRWGLFMSDSSARSSSSDCFGGGGAVSSTWASGGDPIGKIQIWNGSSFQKLQTKVVGLGVTFPLGYRLRSPSTLRLLFSTTS